MDLYEDDMDLFKRVNMDDSIQILFYYLMFLFLPAQIIRSYCFMVFSKFLQGLLFPVDVDIFLAYRYKLFRMGLLQKIVLDICLR